MTIPWLIGDLPMEMSVRVSGPSPNSTAGNHTYRIMV